MSIAANGPALGGAVPSQMLPAPAPIYLIDPISILGHLSYPTTHHTPAHGGAADFQCLRQLPPPPCVKRDENTFTNLMTIIITI